MPGRGRFEAAHITASSAGARNCAWLSGSGLGGRKEEGEAQLRAQLGAQLASRRPQGAPLAPGGFWGKLAPWARHMVLAERGGTQLGNKSPKHQSPKALEPSRAARGVQEAAGPAGWEEAAPWRPGENGCAASSSCRAALGCEDSPRVPNTQIFLYPAPGGVPGRVLPHTPCGGGAGEKAAVRGWSKHNLGKDEKKKNKTSGWR